MRISTFAQNGFFPKCTELRFCFIKSSVHLLICPKSKVLLCIIQGKDFHDPLFFDIKNHKTWWNGKYFCKGSKFVCQYLWFHILNVGVKSFLKLMVYQLWYKAFTIISTHCSWTCESKISRCVRCICYHRLELYASQFWEQILKIMLR